jgi:hypothetical protein
MEAPRDVIEEFLARSYRVVPLGSESALIDMDLLIDRLLDSGGAASL